MRLLSPGITALMKMRCKIPNQELDKLSLKGCYNHTHTHRKAPAPSDMMLYEHQKIPQAKCIFYLPNLQALYLVRVTFFILRHYPCMEENAKFFL